MASVRILLAVFVCIAAVHSSLQDDKLLEKRKELLKLVKSKYSILLYIKTETKQHKQTSKQVSTN